MSAVLMQLLEYFMWIDQKCGNINKISTKLAYILLTLQPFIVIIGFYFIGDQSRIKKKYFLPIVIATICIVIYQIIRVLESTKKDICSKPSKTTPHHLLWDFTFIKSPKWLMMLYFLSPLTLLLIRYFDRSKDK